VELHGRRLGELARSGQERMLSAAELLADKAWLAQRMPFAAAAELLQDGLYGSTLARS